jgi:hypothetical protein
MKVGEPLTHLVTHTAVAQTVPSADVTAEFAGSRFLRAFQFVPMPPTAFLCLSTAPIDSGRDLYSVPS